MKNIGFFLFILIFPFLDYAQNIQGTWEGLLFKKLKICFHIVDTNGVCKSTWDDPEEGIKDLPCTVEKIRDSIVIKMAEAGFIYKGKLDSNNENIIGNWSGSYGNVAFDVRRTSSNSFFTERIFPQEPKPPFPYNIEELEYYNKDSSIKFGATLTFPKIDIGQTFKWRSSYPAVILITGSGQQNRDENLTGPKPFELIADQLARKGIAVLRADDRGIGKSTGNFANSTTYDFAEDIKASINYLKTRKEIDSKKIGLIGHSEGGLIASIVASERNDIAFIVLLAAPGQQMLDVASQQAVDFPIANGYDSLKMTRYKPLFHSLFKIALDVDDTTRAFHEGYLAYKHWQKKNSPEVEKYIFGKIKDDNEIQSYCRRFYTSHHISDPRNFAKLNTADYLSKVSCPVLAINGSRDIIVSSKQNLAAIQKTLKRNRQVKNFEVHEIEGLNHFFQHCQKSTIEELTYLNETFAPEALQIIVNWIRERTK